MDLGESVSPDMGTRGRKGQHLFSKGCSLHWPSRKRVSSDLCLLLRVLTLGWRGGSYLIPGSKEQWDKMPQQRQGSLEGAYQHRAGDHRFHVSDGRGWPCPMGQHRLGCGPLSVYWASLSYGHQKCHRRLSIGSSSLGICL